MSISGHLSLPQRRRVPLHMLQSPFLTTASPESMASSKSVLCPCMASRYDDVDIKIGKARDGETGSLQGVSPAMFVQTNRRINNFGHRNRFSSRFHGFRGPSAGDGGLDPVDHHGFQFQSEEFPEITADLVQSPELHAGITVALHPDD